VVTLDLRSPLRPFFPAWRFAAVLDGAEHLDIGLWEVFLVGELAEAGGYSLLAAGRSFRPRRSDMVTPSALAMA